MTFDLPWFVAAAALFDSLSTTQQIIIVILLFSTERPVRSSLGFIAGITSAYLVCGLVGLAFVGGLNDLVRSLVPDLSAVADRPYYQAEALVGGLLLVAGPAYWLFRRKSRRPTMENRLLSAVKRLNFRVAFVLGAVLSATSFPFAVPYVLSIGKIAASGLGAWEQSGLVAWYNLVYALPMVIPFLLFLLLREGIVHQLHRRVERLNTLLMIVFLSGTGLLLLTDAGLYFLTGRPLWEGHFLLV